MQAWLVVSCFVFRQNHVNRYEREPEKNIGLSLAGGKNHKFREVFAMFLLKVQFTTIPPESETSSHP